METTPEQLDAAERNILYLNEIKSVILSKIQLLKLRLQQSKECSIKSDNIGQERRKLMTSMLMKKNLDNAVFYNLLKLFINDNIINNESDEPQIIEFKEKIFESLQQLNQSTNALQIFFRKLRSLSIQHNGLKEEIFSLRNKLEQRIQESMKEKQNKKDNAKEQSQIERKNQIMLRIEKINLMISMINGLMYNIEGLNWADPEIQEATEMCRSLYKLE